MSPDPIDVVAVMDSVTIKITPPPYLPWSIKWRAVLRSHTALAEAYEETPVGGNLEVDSRVYVLFGDINDVGDWIEGDAKHDPSLKSVRGKAKAHRYAEQPLRIAAGIANVYKHHTITAKAKYDPVTARIESTSGVAGGGSSVVIEYTSPKHRDAEEIDALDLANECLDSWRSFLAKHGISEP